MAEYTGERVVKIQSDSPDQLHCAIELLLVRDGGLHHGPGLGSDQHGGAGLRDGGWGRSFRFNFGHGRFEDLQQEETFATYLQGANMHLIAGGTSIAALEAHLVGGIGKLIVGGEKLFRSLFILRVRFDLTYL